MIKPWVSQATVTQLQSYRSRDPLTLPLHLSTKELRDLLSPGRRSHWCKWRNELVAGTGMKLLLGLLLLGKVFSI